jgi:hypothetical protein
VTGESLLVDFKNLDFLDHTEHLERVWFDIFPVIRLHRDMTPLYTFGSLWSVIGYRLTDYNSTEASTPASDSPRRIGDHDKEA